MILVWGIVAVLFGIVGIIFGALIGVLATSLYYEDRMARAEEICREPDDVSAGAPSPVEESKPSEIPEVPAPRDSLKRISGIGVVFERRLNEAGITTFAQLASVTPDEVAAAVDIEVAPDRIVDDDWIGQAARFAEEG